MKRCLLKSVLRKSKGKDPEPPVVIYLPYRPAYREQSKKLQEGEHAPIIVVICGLVIVFVGFAPELGPVGYHVGNCQPCVIFVTTRGPMYRLVQAFHERQVSTERQARKLLTRETLQKASCRHFNHQKDEVS